MTRERDEQGARGAKHATGGAFPYPKGDACNHSSCTLVVLVEYVNRIYNHIWFWLFRTIGKQ